MNMLQAITEAEKHAQDEFVMTMRFVMKRNQRAKFVAALMRIVTAKTTIKWYWHEEHALLNMAYVVKVTGTGWQISKVIQYFAASGFAF